VGYPVRDRNMLSNSQLVTFLKLLSCREQSIPILVKERAPNRYALT
jgi:hypothetical protein